MNLSKKILSVKFCARLRFADSIRTFHPAAVRNNWYLCCGHQLHQELYKDKSVISVRLHSSVSPKHKDKETLDPPNEKVKESFASSNHKDKKTHASSKHKETFESPPQTSISQDEDATVKTTSGTKVKNYAIKKFLGFIEGHLDKFEKRFEKTYPKAYKIYKLFKDGLKDFWYDSKNFYYVSTGLWHGGKSLADFSYRELDNYRQMPSDMLRVAPVLIISSLPFANYVVFPIAYMLPRQLLCRHFWTPDQRVEFALHDLRPRVMHYPKVVTLLRSESSKIKDVLLRSSFQELLAQVEDMKEPETELILDIIPAFSSWPLDLNSLYKHHRVHMQWHVARSWNFPGRKSKMEESSKLLHHIDLALPKTMNKLGMEALRQACFYRGLNAKDLDSDEMKNFLSRWTKVSGIVSGLSISCLLHLNVLLTYTHANNRTLLPK